MARFLPPQPSLEHLKNEAKALCKAHQAKDPAVCPTLRRLRRFQGAADEQILAAEVPLADAQFALAMDYGFADWAQLRQAVLDCQPLEGSQTPPQPAALLLPPPPAAARQGVNRLASAYHLALSGCGAVCDYDTVAGDSGLAFILQADSLHTAWGANRRELDIGWWPLDLWGSMLRLEFLGRVYGRAFHSMLANNQEYRQDEAEHFRKHFQAAVVQSLRQGRPVLALERDMYVVTGFDDGNPPLLGQVSCSAVAQVNRLEHYPWWIVVLGEGFAPMDRARADAEAVDFAVRLGRDEVDLSHLPGKSTGRRSWELWLSQLADPELCGPHFYHANVVGCLCQNRIAAAACLGAMSRRHSPPAAAALTSAAREYEAVVARLQQADTGKEALSTAAGRDNLISLIREVMTLEAAAQARMDEALPSMR